MSTSLSYIEFVCEQIPPVYAVRYRKMFGEYMVYLNDKPILLVCDDTVFVKTVPQIADCMKDADTGIPYEGSKPHYILDMEDTARVHRVLAVLEQITPLPKKKKAKAHA